MNRPLGVNAPPEGKLPSATSVPVGCSWRPVCWIMLRGPITPVELELIAAAVPTAARTTTSEARIRQPENHLIVERVTGAKPLTS